MSILSRRRFLSQAGPLAVAPAALAASNIPDPDPELVALVARLDAARDRVGEAFEASDALSDAHPGPGRDGPRENYEAVRRFDREVVTPALREHAAAEQALILAIRGRGESAGSGRAAVVGDRLFVDVREYIDHDHDEYDDGNFVLVAPLADVAGWPAGSPREYREPKAPAPPATAIIPGDERYSDVGPLGFLRVTTWTAAGWKMVPPDERPEGTVEFGDGGRLLSEPVPRWEGIVGGRQPRPVASSVGGSMVLGNETIERSWRAEDVKQCRLCRRCEMLSGPFDGLVECTVDVPKGVLSKGEDEADEAAALWSERFGRPLREEER